MKPRELHPDAPPGTFRDDDLTPKEERFRMLVLMREASRVFYSMAVQSRCHAFVEFTGLMNEYIKLCEAADEAGIDFTKTNVHSSGAALPMQAYHAEYLGEKLNCIYGHSLCSNNELMAVLVTRLIGVDGHEEEPADGSAAQGA